MIEDKVLKELTEEDYEKHRKQAKQHLKKGNIEKAKNHLKISSNLLKKVSKMENNKKISQRKKKES
ncbi:MAG: hypothetical protein BTN85_2004 [Candidatus Methanohalarchaeum thermophilum]|uniref:Uncharacterized protein n=1 Tax=Methanohalarchaeum thermophilum TaxID=1903181 RepID=A0A1Q6DSK3_METT1|nr:MAG: hypothetical protein BTN85_2004 [Candidatus Methanohalarchaeum thermophilum]